MCETETAQRQRIRNGLTMAPSISTQRPPGTLISQQRIHDNGLTLSSSMGTSTHRPPEVGVTRGATGSIHAKAKEVIVRIRFLLEYP